MTTPIINVENLSKMYRLGTIGTGTLTHDLKRWYYKMRRWEDPYMKIGEVNKRDSKSKNDYVWALKDINFKVKPGEVLGIIGKNGAGKSTLLKILSKVTGPTTGTIHYNGRIGALLEVGTGFHPELTGRENIFLNGAILGMSKVEIRLKLDEIIDFSGVERYLDTPVKRYSSGMMVRLGFAVAAHLEPEILAVDEVLAVGDAEFQKKAIGKMQDVSRKEGRTVLFVSHNMDSMLNLCHKGILLENGSIKYVSDIQDTVNYYLGSGNVESYYHCKESTKPIHISDVEFLGTKDNISGLFRFDESIALEITIQREKNYKVERNTVLGVVLLSKNGTKIFTVEKKLSEFIDGIKCVMNVSFPNKLISPGDYKFLLAIHIPNIQIIDNVEDICNCKVFDIGSDYLKYNGVNSGFFIVEPEWNKKL